MSIPGRGNVRGRGNVKGRASVRGVPGFEEELWSWSGGSKVKMLWKSQVCKASPALVRTLQDFETGRHGVF